MQNRMREHQMEKAAAEKLLKRAQVASFACIDEQGSPYAVPVHFTYEHGKVYIHGLDRGTKIDYIRQCGRVCLTIWEMSGLLEKPEMTSPCSVNTDYESVVIRGNARILTDPALKRKALLWIVQKYTPHLAELEMPDTAVQSTSVIEVTPTAMTGKYYHS